ncbi:MAG: fluoride efflux transporter CrcB [Planctomycetes bacterium]|nr:fluoride efflux transporter CrcB [Phycisphaerae bacterium]NBB95316.1 fluoride efflux transporter CrcB [Planctomycetota bacterium]
MWNLLYIAAGGAAGALCRYGLSETITTHVGKGFPWGTLAVNLAGCFAIGMAIHLVPTPKAPHELSWLIITGFLGAFTTFSTLSLETHTLLRDGAYAAAAAYVLTSVLAGVALCAAGFWLGHVIHKAIA